MASVESVPAYMHPGVSVSHPPHLDGDPSLATEILPGPPPLASLQQAAMPRKDNKNPPMAFSYLPGSDPGTTYTTHFAVGSVSAAAPSSLDGSRRNKRVRLDKGAEGRSQRASARSLAAVTPATEAIVLQEAGASSSHPLSEFDPALLPADADDTMPSRATSFHAEDTPPECVEPGKRSRAKANKGKGKERELVVKVKEEPVMMSLSNELASLGTNEDHCSACRSLGALVYCDGCPRAFHWICLDPPIEATDIPEGESRWFCPACTLEKKPPPKPQPSLKFMAPLVNELATKIPTEFQLPQDVRTFFKDVGTGAKGAYLDTSEVKAARFNRLGQLEDRDPYRLKDRNGDPVLCFRCGASALPPGMTAESPTAKRTRRSISTNVNNYETGRAIISCDYCHLHWHLDCTDPPLITMPVWSKKWMCPNHAEHVLQPKHRIPRANATPIDITKPRQKNNGNIEIIQAETAPPTGVVPPKVNVDEVLINGRRYRVPERIITLDFWDKVKRNRSDGSGVDMGEVEISSSMSSPLTSLSSLDDQDSIPPFSMEPALFNTDDLRIAQMLCGMRLQGSSSTSSAPLKSAPATNGTHRESRKHIKTESQETSLSVSTHTDKRRKTETGPSSRRAGASRTAAARAAKASKRSTRDDDSTPGADFDYVPSISSGKRPNARRAAARPPAPAPVQAASSAEADVVEVPRPASAVSTSTRPRRTRQPTRRLGTPPLVIKPDPDAPAPNALMLPPAPKASASTLRKKASMSAASAAAKPATPTSASANGELKPPSATPTLKIRLPRIGAFSPQTVAPTAAAVEAAKASPTKAPAAASTVAAAGGSSLRPRRSLRRQASVPTSLTSSALSTSPFESS
ncbi:uncharacterized protein BXZ73DRAFT_37826 [Epithele typhae]|uniref:uncharacterized protein n=1 Tax=Epithele typhae TaxID=378194 RepID=UPI002008EB3D|nr:uncharacterized protein BXZ73DRAFT_37826 [Epithele typhae]KAH9946375.1 hypothetical protein BXZ73DRAFT_37826 [Epithele typhae]